MSFNKVILVGNLTRPLELKYTTGKGTPVAKTGIAVNRVSNVNGERREEVCFVDLTFWGRAAEIANQYLQKGSKILVEGRLAFDQWQDQNGQNRSKHSVTVESMQMLDKKEQGSYDGNNSYNAQQKSFVPSYQSGAAYISDGFDNDFTNINQQNSYQSAFTNKNQNTQNNQQNQKEHLPEYDVDKDEIPF